MNRLTKILIAAFIILYAISPFDIASGVLDDIAVILTGIALITGLKESK